MTRLNLAVLFLIALMFVSPYWLYQQPVAYIWCREPENKEVTVAYLWYRDLGNKRLHVAYIWYRESGINVCLPVAYVWYRESGIIVYL